MNIAIYNKDKIALGTYSNYRIYNRFKSQAGGPAGRSRSFL